ncbi:MAG: hypothetical protein HC904_04940 [Blastochloris sp.]|nr:hypothetical protein [Blastochloris sp.]
MKAFLSWALFCFALPLHADILRVDPDKLVFLELHNGKTVHGRIVDADPAQLHLVGPRINRLIAYASLSPSSREMLGLRPDINPQSNVSVEFQGLSLTRDRLNDSRQNLALRQSRNRLSLPGYITPAFFVPGYFYGFPPPCHQGWNGSSFKSTSAWIKPHAGALSFSQLCTSCLQRGGSTPTFPRGHS